MNQEIRDHLLAMQDASYGEFQRKLIPNIPAESILGVRTPALREYAKCLIREGKSSAFLKDLPHSCFEENQLHAFILSEEKNFACAIDGTEQFLPYVDNWATCDQFSPKAFRKHRPELLAYVENWLSSGKTYTVRFAVGMLMEHFLDSDFDLRFPEMVTAVISEEYYVNMMRAWYFATALAKQYEAVLPYIEQNRLDIWTHNKSIQKAVESRRITEAQKAYLRQLRRK